MDLTGTLCNRDCHPRNVNVRVWKSRQGVDRDNRMFVSLSVLTSRIRSDLRLPEFPKKKKMKKKNERCKKNEKKKRRRDLLKKYTCCNFCSIC